MNEDTQGVLPLFSELRHDPDMEELIDLFTTEMADRLDVIAKAWGRADVETLATMTHQLRGAAPGYGFPTLGTAAARLENLLREGGAGAVATEEARFAYVSFANLCLRVIASGKRKAA